MIAVQKMHINTKLDELGDVIGSATRKRDSEQNGFSRHSYVHTLNEVNNTVTQFMNPG
jgi:hypothetical protein